MDNFYHSLLVSVFILLITTSDNQLLAATGESLKELNKTTTISTLGTPAFDEHQYIYPTASEIGFYFWSQNPEGTSYEIYRSVTDTTHFRLIATIPHNLNASGEFYDSNLKSRTTYYYKIRAVKGEDVSAFSRIQGFTTLPIAYHPIFTAVAIDENTIQLTLTDLSYFDLHYEIELDLNGFFVWLVTFPTDSGGTEVILHDMVEPGATYHYVVRMILDYPEGGYPYEFVGEATVTTPEAGACTNSGSIEREVWSGIPGTNVSVIPLTDPPTSTSSLTMFEAPSNNGTDYGARMRGYICPPQTGNYIFWIASDDNSELWLSTDDTPVNKVKVASVPGHTSIHQWTKYASQKSAEIHLVKGERYYIEALHKEAAGVDHLAAGWQLPDGTLERPMPGTRLIPFSAPPLNECAGTGSIKWEVWNNVSGTDINPDVFNGSPDHTNMLSSFESPQYFGNNYASRVSGYLCVPGSGDYTFWIASDDKSELWLSTDDNPSNIVRIASVPGYAPYGRWDKYPEQKSNPVSLKGGQRYYIEARHKEGGGADYISVGWEIPRYLTNIPNTTLERPIPGNRLLPFEGVHPAPSCDDETGGGIVRQIWRDIPGTLVSSIPVDTQYDETQQLTNFETGIYYANDYGSRIQAWICVPTTGDYTFWISSDDNSELWLSTTDDPSAKIKIAFVNGATRIRQWDKYPSQQSALVRLVAGYKYYIEALHKEANGNDHVEVGWQLPDGALERPIPGNRLIMYDVFNITAALSKAAPVSVIGVVGEIKNELELYPNPVRGHEVTLKVRTENPESLNRASVQVISAKGGIVQEQNVNYATGDCGDILLAFKNDVQPGVYLVNLIMGRKRLSKKLVIE